LVDEVIPVADKEGEFMPIPMPIPIPMPMPMPMPMPIPKDDCDAAGGGKFDRSGCAAEDDEEDILNPPSEE